MMFQWQLLIHIIEKVIHNSVETPVTEKDEIVPKSSDVGSKTTLNVDDASMEFTPICSTNVLTTKRYVK